MFYVDQVITMLKILLIILWPFWIILKFIKRLLWSYFGEFARAKKEGASTGEHGGFDGGDSGG